MWSETPKETHTIRLHQSRAVEESEIGNVIDIGCNTKLDIPVEKVIEGAKDLDVALVIGWRDNDFVMATSDGDLSSNNLLIDLAKRLIMDTMLENA